MNKQAGARDTSCPYWCNYCDSLSTCSLEIGCLCNFLHVLQYTLPPPVLAWTKHTFNCSLHSLVVKIFPDAIKLAVQWFLKHKTTTWQKQQMRVRWHAERLLVSSRNCLCESLGMWRCVHTPDVCHSLFAASLCRRMVKIVKHVCFFSWCLDYICDK